MTAMERLQGAREWADKHNYSLFRELRWVDRLSDNDIDMVMDVLETVIPELIRDADPG